VNDATVSSWLPLAVVVPIGGAVVAPIAGRFSRRLPVLVCLATLGVTLGVLLAAAPSVLRGAVLVHYLGHWRPIGGASLGIAVAADPFGLAYGVAVAVVGGALLVATASELRGLASRELGWYACLFQLLLAALVGAGLTADLFNLFVWFEVAALASYGLTGFFLERPIALEAAFKVLVLTTLASFAIFVGASLLYREHGALNLGQLHDALAGGATTPDRIAIAVLLAGFWTKAGLVPFHGWLPDAHTAAPGPVSAMFSGLMVSMGMVATARIAFQLGAPGTGELGLLMTLGLASALVGGVLALRQDDLKRLLAYDTISQMGVVAVGLATASAEGVAGAATHLLDHALFKALLFLCAGAIVHATGETSLARMGGLARRRPLLAAAFVLGVAAIAGVPPLNGYASVGMIHGALLASGQGLPLGLLLVAQALTIGALGRAAYLAFFRPRAEPYEHLESLRPGLLGAFATLGTLCVVAGVLAVPFDARVAEPAAGSLLHGAAYASGVLAGGGRLPVAARAFHYLSATELLLVAGTITVGAAIAVTATRRAVVTRWLRPVALVHTGSVNDYATMWVAGLVLAAVVIAR